MIENSLVQQIDFSVLFSITVQCHEQCVHLNAPLNLYCSIIITHDHKTLNVHEWLHSRTKLISYNKIQSEIVSFSSRSADTRTHTHAHTHINNCIRQCIRISMAWGIKATTSLCTRSYSSDFWPILSLVMRIDFLSAHVVLPSNWVHPRHISIPSCNDMDYCIV